MRGPHRENNTNFAFVSGHTQQKFDRGHGHGLVPFAPLMVNWCESVGLASRGCVLYNELYNGVQTYLFPLNHLNRRATIIRPNSGVLHCTPHYREPLGIGSYARGNRCAGTNWLIGFIRTCLRSLAAVGPADRWKASTTPPKKGPSWHNMRQPINMYSNTSLGNILPYLIFWRLTRNRGRPSRLHIRRACRTSWNRMCHPV